MLKYNDFLNESKKELNNLIDYTYLKDDATIDNIKNVCNMAVNNHFYAICIRPKFVSTAVAFLDDAGVKVCTVISFPNGDSKQKEKIEETDKALTDGADEIDLVMDYKKLIKMSNLIQDKEYEEKYKDMYDYLINDIKNVVRKAHSEGAIVKVIIETGALNYEQIKIACEICVEAGADFVKTSTGFFKKDNDSLDEKLDKVKYMRKILPDYIDIKLSGGIRTYDDAEEFLPYVDRIGTSAIIKPTV